MEKTRIRGERLGAYQEPRWLKYATVPANEKAIAELKEEEEKKAQVNTR